ncbi:unnamed protein product [marine sediment metagenome]|uniref:Uncharacterized protein n=1 Tax=marine sediment metagenome TaxID=412755 RepID=X1T9I9_9ZZZZ
MGSAVIPLINLTEEALKHIEGLDIETAEVHKDLDALESLGFDVSMPRERVQFAEKARKVILDRFGPQK